MTTQTLVFVALLAFLAFLAVSQATVAAANADLHDDVKDKESSAETDEVHREGLDNDKTDSFLSRQSQPLLLNKNRTELIIGLDVHDTDRDPDPVTTESDKSESQESEESEESEESPSTESEKKEERERKQCIPLNPQEAEDLSMKITDMQANIIDFQKLLEIAVQDEKYVYLIFRDMANTLFCWCFFSCGVLHQKALIFFLFYHILQ